MDPASARKSPKAGAANGLRIRGRRARHRRAEARAGVKAAGHRNAIFAGRSKRWADGIERREAKGACGRHIIAHHLASKGNVDIKSSKERGTGEWVWRL